MAGIIRRRAAGVKGGPRPPGFRHNGVMRIVGLLPLLPLLLACRLCAWSPSFHESQTLLAARLTPQGMAGFLQAHRDELLQGARGQANDQVPTVEEVEAQFKLIIGLSDGSVRPGRVVRELGVLAHQVELLTDPSAVRGTTALRDSFEAYADEKLPHLVLSREPFWAVHAAIDSRPVLLRWAKVKYERHEVLLGCFDETSGRRDLGGRRYAMKLSIPSQRRYLDRNIILPGERNGLLPAPG
jgi:hypothetical protein